ncbi:MAG: anion permease [Actinomycetota bacterium]
MPLIATTHTASLALVIGIIAVALFFDFSNGFHDAANSIATVVSTRVLSPRIAVIWAAVFNFVAFLVFGTKVANTVGKTVSLAKLPHSARPETVILAGVIGAVAWNLITWRLGLPTSSSHALIGGLAGAGVAAARGFHSVAGSVLNSESIKKTAIFIVVSPVVGLILGFFFMTLMMLIFHRARPRPVERGFRVAQLFSAAAYSLGHGGNDAQKTMGVIAALLVSTGYATQHGKDLPIGLHQNLWIILAAQTAIALGTLSGGWRIVKTLGSKITKLKPVGGFSAETAAAGALFGATHFGIPVSTTHTITGAIVGVGSTQRLSAVRWGVAGRIVWAWVLTIPAAAVISYLSYRVVDLVH